MEGNLCTTTGTAVCRIGADRDLHFGLGLHRSLPALVLGFTGVARRRPLLLSAWVSMCSSAWLTAATMSVDFRESDDVTAAALDCDFGDVAVFLVGQDDFALDAFTQNFAEFAEALLDLVANGGSDFVLTARYSTFIELPSAVSAA